MKILKYIIIQSLCVLGVVGCCGDPTAAGSDRVLYNGIELPDVWPPRYEEPTAAGEMPVPYLKTKPAVIPVNVGRQLFVDDFLIAESNMGTTCHKPVFYPGNPVLEPTEAWEQTTEGAPYAAPFSDGVWFDETDNTFKMWYLAGAGSIHKQDKQTFYTGYAESKDGRKWIKHASELYPGTSIVDTCNRDAATIWLDRMEKDPNKRFKMFNVERRPTDRRWQFVLKYSSDGVHWSQGVAQSGDLYDRSSAFYNPFRGVWCLSMRYSTEVSSRSRSYTEAADPQTVVSMAHRTRRGIPDQNVVYWFTPDAKEPRHPDFPEVDPGIYNFDCIAYESIMLGQYSVWLGPENHICDKLGIQKRNEIMLGYSRDGFHFSRPSFEPFLAVNETDGAWNWGNMQSAGGVPIIVGDSLYFYMSGRRLNKIMWDSYTSTGLATLRRDGFVSRDADNEERYLITEPLSFDGSYLFVNADVRGKLQVEVLDVDKKPIKGFAKTDISTIERGNSTRQLVCDLSPLKGKNIRLKFTMTDGALYSFWVSPWTSGESRGYTAGGGPGLSPDGVDQPIK